MSKAGTLENVRFNHTGLTHNGRVFMKGEAVAKEALFVNGFEELSDEEQLENYHLIFYTPTKDPVTDPTKHIAEPEPVALSIGPQLAEAASPRVDGMGTSELGNARRGSLASASVSKVDVKGEVLSETPLLPETKKRAKVGKKSQAEDADNEQGETLVLRRKIGRSKKVESSRKNTKRKSRFVAAQGTKLSSRR